MPELTTDLTEQLAAIMAGARANWPGDFRMAADVELDTSDDDVDETDDGDGDEGDGSGQNEEDTTPYVKEDGKPFTAKDYEALNTALQNARKAERAARRAAKGKPADNDAAAKAAEAKYKPIVVKQAARGALLEAGLAVEKGKEQAALSKALKLLDMDEIDLSDDGDVEGLTEQIDELKSTWPQLFVRKGTRRIDGADRGTPPGKKLSSADQLTAMLTGGE